MNFQNLLVLLLLLLLINRIANTSNKWFTRFGSWVYVSNKWTVLSWAKVLRVSRSYLLISVSDNLLRNGYFSKQIDWKVSIQSCHNSCSFHTSETFLREAFRRIFRNLSKQSDFWPISERLKSPQKITLEIQSDKNFSQKNENKLDADWTYLMMKVR